MDELTYLHEDRVFQRSEAIASSYSDRDLVRALRAGQIVRIRHGAYAPRSTWEAAGAEERHLMRAHATLRSHTMALALSHTSAAVEHGLRLHETDLSRSHVLCLGKPLARTTPDVVYHQGATGPASIESRGEHLTVDVARAALGAALTSSQRGALVVLDSALDLGLAEAPRLLQEYDRISTWPGARTLQVPLRLMRVGANSAGETLARHMMWLHSIPEPVLQYPVRDRSGTLIGTTDFAWPEYGVLGEFDGAVKYGALLRPGESPQDAVIREKRREDRLRAATGWLMFRMMWTDLNRPEQTCRRLRDQLDAGRALHARSAI